ncbi:MAG: TolC family protein, partial [Planctomycetes bacterium]|nr:TolC family protein [Planctomycetota bacterium]
QSKARIGNAYKSYLRRKNDWEKADFINRMGQSQTVFEAPRARASFRSAEASLVSAKEQYQTALDRFKISIGMPVDVLLDVVSQEDDIEAGALDRLLTAADEATAIDVALHHRLDLLTAADQVDDSRREVLVAKNGLLPSLQVTAGMYLDSDPERSNSTTYNLERATYQAGLALEMDDRKAERTAYRQALITLRRAERAYGETVDGVRADVREALRDIDKQENLRAIQALNVQENEVRYEAASAQYDLGRSTNQDVVDADTDLLAARNELARAVADYRNSILRFRLATGTLRVTDDGTWDDLAAYLPAASTTVPPAP